MHKRNIADFILYDMSKNHVRSGFGVNTEVISEIVEGWNQKIYVTPSESIKFYHSRKNSFTGLN